MAVPRKIGPTGPETGNSRFGTLHPRGAEMTPDLYAWLDRAACIGTDPNIFFDDTVQAITKAKQICATCPVKAECIEDGRRADAVLGPYGVRGGLTAEERTSQHIRACANCGDTYASRRRKFCLKPECQKVAHTRTGVKA